jgi:hypothetical protein
LKGLKRAKENHLIFSTVEEAEALKQTLLAWQGFFRPSAFSSTVQKR